MSTNEALSLELCRCRALVANLGVAVREMKKTSTTSKEALDSGIAALLEAKKALHEAEKAFENSKPFYTKNRSGVENLARRRSIFFSAFEIYGGTAGLFDWGPPGCALKAEVEALWRRHFVLAEDMLEISGPALTPLPVLRASGHVDRFTDLITSDIVTGEQFRADKLLEEFVDQQVETVTDDKLREELILVGRKADGFSKEEMRDIFIKYNVKSPNGNDLSPPVPFNLMFPTTIGPRNADSSPEGVGQAFLRPETAQGIFVNFRRLLEFNNGKMPFAAAQIGLGFRNEIAPRNGLLRVREFQMAEIEHFVDPQNKEHSNFSAVKDLQLPLYPREKQLSDGQVVSDMTLEAAVACGMINNTTLAYFMGRTYLFLMTIGIRPQGVRFRQHLATEMAHYAADCWDAEIECSYGWIECVGIADRSAYDLTAHEKATGTPMMAQRRLAPGGELRTVVELEWNKPVVGKKFKKNAAMIMEGFAEGKSQAELIAIGERLSQGESVMFDEWEISKDMVTVLKKEKRVFEESYVPSVIEPSFGIGRIVYCLLEHTYRVRETDQDRAYLSLPASIAPVKCSLLTLSNDPSFAPLSRKIKEGLVEAGVSCKVDQTSASIGKRYARTDEIGIPYGITIDFQSVKDETVTLRERDSMSQVRLSAEEVPEVVKALVLEKVTWKRVQEKFPVFTEQQ